MEAVILVTGSREIDNPSLMREAARASLHLLDVPLSLAKDCALVHGAARGADTAFANACRSLGIDAGQRAIPAEWNKHDNRCPPSHATQSTCKMAGHRRNGLMLDVVLELMAAGVPALCVAFPLGTAAEKKSRGTWNMIGMVQRTALPLLAVQSGQVWPGNAPGRELAAGCARRTPGLALGNRSQLPLRRLSDELLPF